MNGRQLLGVLLIVSSSASLIGCFSHSRTVIKEREVSSRPVIRDEAPPPPRDESPGQPPSPGDIWVSGHYEKRGGDWMWVPGYWRRP